MDKQGAIYKSTKLANFDGQKMLIIIITLASMLMAVLFGLFAVTANPIIIGIAVALIVGAVLIVNPIWIVWLIVSLGLLVAGLLPLFFEAFSSKLSWGVSLLGLMLLVLVLFRMLLTAKDRNETPVFVWLALCFLVYALINSLIQWYSLEEFLSGFKRYFQVWSLLFALCWFFFDKNKILHVEVFILIIALVQLPFALYERIVYVPIREGLMSSYPGLVPIDIVSGTFGASLTGGGANAEMSIFLVIVLGFLLARWKENVLSTKKLLVMMPIILFPLLLGETKAVVVMVPLMFAVLFRREMFVKLHYWLIGMLGVIAFVTVAGYTYVSLGKKTLDEKFNETYEYNLGEKGYGKRLLNRTTVLTFWAEKQGLHDPVSLIFGNGIGSSHSSTQGHLQKKYPHYGIGLTATSTLLWEMGLIGFCLFVSILVFAWYCANKLLLDPVESKIKADLAAIQAAIALFVFFIFYRSALLENLGIQIIFAMLLGYLAWIYRNHLAVHRKIEQIHE